MALPAGTKLGPYQIVAPIGAGGMGEVYRARDTNLDRDVAIKVLPAALAQDPERLVRFEREAKVLAALNHPNIAQIYGIEQGALVMELVEGEMLSGPLPLTTALDYARQIAGALEAAHEKGIVHRDLKPANIKVTPHGVVKVLDFGLAAVLQNPTPLESNATESPTLTLSATRSGVLLGTAGYMSPEQARGKPVDKRADIWAFGVVLYEMVLGRKLFRGDNITSTLAEVLLKEPDLNEVPPQIRRVLRRCLEKDANKRLRDITGVELILEELQEPPLQSVPIAGPWRTRFYVSAAAAAVLSIAASVLAFLHFREPHKTLHALRYSIAAPKNSQVRSFAVSPDGRLLAIAGLANGKQQLWLRSLDALQEQPMSNTDDASFPFWSPDSQYIGFFAQGKLKKVAASGGPVQSLCDVSQARGGTWNREGVILFSPSGNSPEGIQRVPSSGGVPVDVFREKGSLRYPVFLPDGRHFLYTDIRPSERSGIYVSSLNGAENRRVLADRSAVVFAPSLIGGSLGHLLFVRENNLMALPFDAATARATGDVFSVVDGLTISVGIAGFAPLTVSADGLLIYEANAFATGALTQLVWYDRAGKLLGPIGAAGNLLSATISPNQKVAAFARQSAAGNDIWLRDLTRGTDTRFTTLGGEYSPSWSPRGDRIVFSSLAGRGAGTGAVLYQKASSGSGPDELLLPPTPGLVSNQWSRDGRFIVYTRNDPKTRQDLWVLPMDQGAPKGSIPVSFLQTEFNEFEGQISPDSQWMAYTSDESGQREVYVRPFPSGEGKWKVSTAGGDQPRWRGDGKELFYEAADRKMTAVAIKATAGSTPSLETGIPVPLFECHLMNPGTNLFQYDVTADGKRFLAVTDVAAFESSPPLTVVANWNAGLKR